MIKAVTLAGEESTFGGLIRKNLEFLGFGGMMKDSENFRLHKMSSLDFTRKFLTRGTKKLLNTYCAHITCQVL